MEVYLDNAATTRTLDSVSDKVKQVMCETYGNPSSRHKKGFDGEREIKSATECIVKKLKCKEKEIIYTSGGTESNNLAVIGAAMANKRRGKHIISTTIEHPSVYESMKYLEEQGFEITYLPVRGDGKVDEEVLQQELREDTILVSVMYVNNEIGSVQDLCSLSRIVHEVNTRAIFHTDAIQAFGKYNIIPSREGIDLMSVSAHKFNGPKGVGFLYVREGVKINPILFGGGQQRAMRSGTENVPGIAGLAVAIDAAYQSRESKIEQMYSLKETFIADLLEQVEGITINGWNPDSVRETAPHIVSVSFDKIKSEVLLHALEEKGIYVSSGSACASNHPGISSVLKAIGVKDSLLDSTLRFSFSADTTKEHLIYTVEQLKELVPVLRRYQRY